MLGLVSVELGDGLAGGFIGSPPARTGGGERPRPANANPSGESTGVNGPLVVNGANDASSQHHLRHSGEGAWVRSGAGEMSSRATSVVRAGEVRVAVDAVTARGAAGSCTATSRTVSAVAAGVERGGVTPAFPVTRVGRDAPDTSRHGHRSLVVLRAAHGCTRGGRRLGVDRRRVRDGFRQGRVIGGQLAGLTAHCRDVAARLLRRLCAAGGIHHPRWLRRTDAPFDAEVPDLEASTEPDPGVEAPFVSVTAAVDVPAGLAVVPMVVEVPWDSEVPLVPAAPAVTGRPPEGADWGIVGPRHARIIRNSDSDTQRDRQPTDAAHKTRSPHDSLPAKRSIRCLTAATAVSATRSALLRDGNLGSRFRERAQ